MNNTLHQILVHPFTWGLALGLVFVVLAVYRIVRLKGDIKRYKRHLSDKMEIEAETHQKNRTELERLKKENENMRVKIAGLNELPERRLDRDLEIYARAEKRMLIGVPGFAAAWENAKHEAIADLQAEEAGRSLPQRVFARLFPATDKPAALSDASSSSSTPHS